MPREPREPFTNNNGIEITPERQRQIETILMGSDLTIDHRGNSPLLPAEFWAEQAKASGPLNVQLCIVNNHTFVLISTHEIPLKTLGRLRWTRRDGSTGTTPYGHVSSVRHGKRKEDEGQHRFITQFVIEKTQY